MGATWRVRTDGHEVSGPQAVTVIGDAGETWFECDDGRLLCVVTNGERAVVMLLREAGDEGEHAIDPDASGTQDGYVLGNGQEDVYPNRDTVTLAAARTVVERIIDRDDRPSDVSWQVDRAPE
jgi:hypothetical protein